MASKSLHSLSDDLSKIAHELNISQSVLLRRALEDIRSERRLYLSRRHLKRRNKFLRLLKDQIRYQRDHLRHHPLSVLNGLDNPRGETLNFLHRREAHYYRIGARHRQVIKTSGPYANNR